MFSTLAPGILSYFKPGETTVAPPNLTSDDMLYGRAGIVVPPKPMIQGASPIDGYGVQPPPPIPGPNGFPLSQSQREERRLKVTAPGFYEYNEDGSSSSSRRLTIDDGSESIDELKNKFTELPREDQLGIVDDVISEANLMTQLFSQQSIAGRLLNKLVENARPMDTHNDFVDPMSTLGKLGMEMEITEKIKQLRPLPGAPPGVRNRASGKSKTQIKFDSAKINETELDNFVVTLDKIQNEVGNTRSETGTKLDKILESYGYKPDVTEDDYMEQARDLLPDGAPEYNIRMRADELKTSAKRKAYEKREKFLDKIREQHQEFYALQNIARQLQVVKKEERRRRTQMSPLAPPTTTPEPTTTLSPEQEANLKKGILDGTMDLKWVGDREMMLGNQLILMDRSLLMTATSFILNDVKYFAIPKLNEVTKALCRNCRSTTSAELQPGGFVYDEANCPICDYHYEYRSLQCPEGTISLYGSSLPEDCTQQGQVIAVVNIYKCYPPRPCWLANWEKEMEEVPLLEDQEFHIAPSADDFCADLLPTHPLCGQQFEMELYIQDPKRKKSYLWAEPIPNSEKVVEFLAYKPLTECTSFPDDCTWAFQNVTLQPMDISVMTFNFTKLHPELRLNTIGDGHYNIYIMSDKYEMRLETEANKMEKLKQGHRLPQYFRRKANEYVADYFEIKMLALEALTFRVEIHLLHGIHTENLHGFNESLDIKVYSPGISWGGTRKFFVSVLSRELLNGGAYELPYNMPPFISGHHLEQELVMDLPVYQNPDAFNGPQTFEYDSNSGSPPTDESIRNIQVQSNIFWNVERIETVSFAWLPFFSNCEGYDSHIVIWDLLEQPEGRLEKDGPFGYEGECEIYTPEEVILVEPLMFNPNTLEYVVDPIADSCNFVIECRYEESMIAADNMNIIWREIEEEEGELFYITQYPIDFEQFDPKTNGIDAFTKLVGSDQLVKVAYAAEGREAKRFPRRVSFDIAYLQKTTQLKAIVGVEFNFGAEYDDDDTDNVYYLMLSFGALGWQDLMNAFMLDPSIYGVLYVVVGLASIGVAIIAWALVRLSSKNIHTPPFDLKECYEFMLWWPVQGVLIASTPVVVLFAIIVVMIKFDPASQVPCQYDELADNIMDSFGSIPS
jgi:hypothetical protein